MAKHLFKKGEKRGRWKPGESGNPSGRPKGFAELQAAARDRAPEAIDKLMDIMNGKILVEEMEYKQVVVPDATGTRLIKKYKLRPTGRLIEGAAPASLQLEAAQEILNRAMGKPVQPLAGIDDSNSPIPLTRVEHVVVHVDDARQPKIKTIEHMPMPSMNGKDRH